MTSLGKVACGLLGILSWLTVNVSVAQIHPAATEVLLKPFLAELLKSDFDSLSFCVLGAVKEGFGNPATSMSGKKGFGLTCGVETKNTPKIWYVRLAEGGTYVKGHFLDQLVKRIEFSYQDGSILGLANTSIPTFIMFDPQGKTIWEYQTQATDDLPLENVMIIEIKDGYVIAYYSSDIYSQATGDYNLLNVSVEKIDRQGKRVWSNNLKEAIDKKAHLFAGEGSAVDLWALQDSKFALSIATNSLDGNGNPNAIHYNVHYYNSDGRGKVQRGFNIKGSAANADQGFSVDLNGNMIFIGYTGKGQEDWQTVQQLQLTSLNRDGEIVWRQQIVPSIAPQTDTKVGAICMLWKALTDPQGDYVVICEQRYADENGWVPDPSYNQLMAYRFNQEGKKTSITTLLNGEKVRKNLYFDFEGAVIAVGKNVVFSQGQLLIGLTKPVAELSKKELEQLMLSKNSGKITERLGIKIYQISLPTK